MRKYVTCNDCKVIQSTSLNSEWNSQLSRYILMDNVCETLSMIGKLLMWDTIYDRQFSLLMGHTILEGLICP